MTPTTFQKIDEELRDEFDKSLKKEIPALYDLLVMDTILGIKLGFSLRDWFADW